MNPSQRVRLARAASPEDLAAHAALWKSREEQLRTGLGPPVQTAGGVVASRRFTLSSTTGKSQELRIEDGGEPVLRTLRFQTDASVDVTIVELIGDAAFVRPVLTLAPTIIRPIRTFAQNLSVAVTLHGGNTSANVNVAAIEGPSDVFGDTFCSTFAIAATRSASVLNGSGMLAVSSITAKALTTPCYPMFLDLPSSTPPTTTVTVPIAGSVGAIMSAAGVQDSYIDQNMQYVVTFATGLWFALSTTPDVWTDPGVGNTAVGSATVGQ